MSSEPKHRTVPLPEGWPRQVRSAIIHAVSMARTAFVARQTCAEHHADARFRLQSDIDALRREVALLNEELRIKDARMERVPAQRRPHYPPIERLNALTTLIVCLSTPRPAE